MLHIIIPSSMGNDNPNDSGETKPTVARSAIELQKMKLDKLMKNPDKLVVIPDRLKEKKSPHIPEFVRNVMGSSAGAGSGEFHVYRHLRRKEYARQKFIQEKAEKDVLEEAYHQKILENKQASDQKTAKKREKRQKQKARKKQKKSQPVSEKNDDDDDDVSDDNSNSDSDDDS